jgi:predicted transcriptional regulator
MKHKYFVILLAIVTLGRKTGKTPTIGEIAKFLGIPKSTVRNRVIWLFGAGLAVCEKEEYKSTGKYLIYPTVNGLIWVQNREVLF